MFLAKQDLLHPPLCTVLWLHQTTSCGVCGNSCALSQTVLMTVATSAYAHTMSRVRLCNDVVMPLMYPRPCLATTKAWRKLKCWMACNNADTFLLDSFHPCPDEISCSELNAYSKLHAATYVDPCGVRHRADAQVSTIIIELSRNFFSFFLLLEGGFRATGPRPLPTPLTLAACSLHLSRPAVAYYNSQCH